jgi:hypothetical protein
MCPWDEEKKYFNCSLDTPMGISLFRVVKTILVSLLLDLLSIAEGVAL